MDNGLVDYVDALSSPSRNQSSYDVLAHYLEGQGFIYANVGFMDSASNTALGLYSNMDSDWLNHYVEAGFAAHDPLFGLLERLNGDILLDKTMCKSLPSTAQTISDRMFDEIEDLGYRSNVVSVTQSPSLGKTIGINMISDLSRDDLERVMNDRKFDLSMAVSLAQLPMLEELAGGKPGTLWMPFTEPVPKLSPREREVLQWLAQGLRVDRIADRMMLSNATVNFHINAAKKRLGADTREQAIAIALMHRLL